MPTLKTNAQHVLDLHREGRVTVSNDDLHYKIQEGKSPPLNTFYRKTKKGKRKELDDLNMTEIAEKLRTMGYEAIAVIKECVVHHQITYITNENDAKKYIPIARIQRECIYFPNDKRDEGYLFWFAQNIDNAKGKWKKNFYRAIIQYQKGNITREELYNLIPEKGLDELLQKKIERAERIRNGELIEEKKTDLFGEIKKREN